MDGEDELRERIEKRAYELFEARGRLPGHEHQDWLQAERELQLSPYRIEVVEDGQHLHNADPAVREAFDLNGIDGRELTGHLHAPSPASRRVRARGR